jgi:hypothetical protein
VENVKCEVMNRKLFENFTFSLRTNFNSEKAINWFISTSPANPNIKARKCSQLFLCFHGKKKSCPESMHYFQQDFSCCEGRIFEML